MVIYFLFNITNYFYLLWSDDLTKSNTGSSSDSEKVIQRLTDELQEAQESAKIEKHKYRELQGKRKSTQIST